VAEEPVPDSPAAAEAYRKVAALVEAIGKLPVRPDVDVAALVAQLAEVLRPNLEPLVAVLNSQSEAVAAIASRPITVEVNLPAAKRRVVKETKFQADEKGRITGKREVEEEE
jgi:hypothetical protein